jgi:hypothetical protein
MTRELLQRALDALGPIPPLCCGCVEEWQIAIDAVKEALTKQNEFKPDWDEKLALTEEVICLSKRIEELEAQPEQEPVAHMNQNGVIRKVGYEWGPNNTLTSLYTTPPQRTLVGLTDEEIVLIVAECAASHQHTDIHFARAIETKLKQKNT